MAIPAIINITLPHFCERDVECGKFIFRRFKGVDNFLFLIIFIRYFVLIKTVQDVPNDPDAGGVRSVEDRPV
jgi:hypothetical protein